ncbi:MULTISPECIES: glucosaminidase domain-containing protein [Streptococcus]|uniref:Putative endo-beta-N-acetylglucosaminidase n=1 Tax=Streptococcus mitis TaxID=28037 RepID=A0A3R9K5U1_STRMT|nr:MULTISPECIES: glucosaminidase domain-containing protein [Streptococcus]MBZ2105979.1 glucosaminidase domain-containing protein [Streptococcus mitis]MBZ2109527.1 glucosaminidase domain-containing protein [Streptococcus mitis]MDU1739796.1 glucosaminidase domain-containing protein [Streptococcus mitis]RRD33375.1 endo-beta-N-acetylglucosaminidase [Streptococcus sp. OH4692_COT-348]RSI97796.1 putative endo-beta-N-acetylglucosaminidase precursor [Streptococcus mitis]
MKRILLVSTAVLALAIVPTASVFAEDSKTTDQSQTTNKSQSVDKNQSKDKNQTPASEEKKVVENTKNEAEKTEKKKEPVVVKENNSKKEAISNKEKVEEAHKNGWQKEHGKWLFYENNQPIKNWKKIAGVWYFFDQHGIMAINRIVNDYAFHTSGAMVENSWVKIADKWYYATDSGKIVRNRWEKIGNVWYYFKQDGVMASNALVNDYLLNSSGAMAQNAWVKMSDKWYYATDSGKILRNKWEKIKGAWYYFNNDGVMASNQWKNAYYLKKSGAMAEKEWIFDKSYNSWFYLKSGGAYASREWIGAYYLKSGGYMAKNEWIFDSNYNAWYYLKEDGSYVTGGFNIKNKEYFFQDNGKWIQIPKYFKVKPITAYIYSESGDILSYVNQGSIVTYDGSKTKGSRLAVSISGLSGYMNQSDLTLVEEGSEFIPHYTTDGRFLYHELSPYTSIRVAPHTSAMKIGKKYYSKDGEHFDGFTIKNRFLFKNLTEPTNYNADELNRVYSMMNIRNSRLAGKGAIFKEAEKRYGVNALYLMAHSALESAWGRSQIANDKNNFFGIAAYDTSPYDSAKKFDDVDKGILGAAKWIRENYIDRGRDHLGNKATGMNVRYASDPYWGEKIASIMMNINSRLGGKD